MRIWAVVASLAAFAVACQPSAGVPPTEDPAGANLGETSRPTARPVEPTEEQAFPAESNAEDPTQAAPIRLELEATDPTTVELASGKPTFVEFFAFW